MTARTIGWYFVAFFGFVAAVNAVMVTIAIRTHSGVVTEHPYEKGLAYNAVVRAEKQQAALGWSSQMDYKNGALHFTLHDANHQRITPERASATITRPTTSGMDFTVTLNGIKTPIVFPIAGLWEVQVDVSHAGTHYQQRKRIVVP